MSRPPVTKVIGLDDEGESLIAFAVPERIGHPALTVRIPLDGSPAERADCRRVEVERLLELGRVDSLAAEPEEGALRVHLVSPAGPTDAIIRLQPFHGYLRRVFVSPDGTRAAVVSEQFGSDAHLVRAFDTRTRERLWETTIEREPVSVAWRSDGSTWIVTRFGTWDVETHVHVLDRRGERSIPVIEDVGLIHNHHNVIVPLLQCIVVGRRVHELPPVLAHLWPNGRACRSFFDTLLPGADRTSPATVRLDDQGLDYIRPKGERLFESKRYGFMPR